ncbi:hypothetical protein I6G79_31125 [Burkholderia plantarii]|nr:hypothetical protein [Burkholderia plantarii]
MAQAAQWLKRSHRSVGEIGERVGYQLEAAFHRAFSRCHGVGPGRFRRAHRVRRRARRPSRRKSRDRHDGAGRHPSAVPTQ